MTAKLKSPQRLDKPRDHLAHVDPFGTGGEGERHPVLEHGLGEIDHVVDRRREPAFDHGLGAHGKHQRLARSRRWTPGDILVDEFVGLRAGTRRANELEDGVSNLFANPGSGGSVLELTTLIAIIVYALVAWLIARVVWLLAGENRSATRTVASSTRARLD